MSQYFFLCFFFAPPPEEIALIVHFQYLMLMIFGIVKMLFYFVVLTGVLHALMPDIFMILILKASL